MMFATLDGRHRTEGITVFNLVLFTGISCGIAVAVSVLTPFGVSRDGALALILVMQAIAYAVVTAFGVPGLYRFKGWRSAVAQG